MLARDNILPGLGHPADGLQDLGHGKTLRHQHGQVQALSGKHPALACDSLLLALGHPANGVQDQGNCKTLQHQRA